MIRIAVAPLVAACLTLGACNVVVTKAPLFSKADESGAPPLRPGLWRLGAEPDCALDESKPVIDWPKCARGVVIKDGAGRYYDRESGPAVWSTQPIIVTAGTPRIGQVQAKISGDVKVSADPYIYAGIRAVKTDGEGRIVVLGLWPVQCGPPPSGDSTAGTGRPLAGIEMAPGDRVCTTKSSDALRAAAKASEAWTPKLMTARWLRDANP